MTEGNIPPGFTRGVGSYLVKMMGMRMCVLGGSVSWAFVKTVRINSTVVQ